MDIREALRLSDVIYRRMEKEGEQERIVVLEALVSFIKRYLPIIEAYQKAEAKMPEKRNISPITYPSLAKPYNEAIDACTLAMAKACAECPAKVHTVTKAGMSLGDIQQAEKLEGGKK